MVRAHGFPAFVMELDGILQEFNNRTSVIQVGPSKAAVQAKKIILDFPWYKKKKKKPFFGLVIGQDCEKDSFLHFCNKHCGLGVKKQEFPVILCVHVGNSKFAWLSQQKLELLNL